MLGVVVMQLLNYSANNPSRLDPTALSKQTSLGIIYAAGNS
jgi:hypothetical protein